MRNSALVLENQIQKGITIDILMSRTLKMRITDLVILTEYYHRFVEAQELLRLICFGYRRPFVHACECVQS